MSGHLAVVGLGPGDARCLTLEADEALAAARGRRAFGKAIVEYPLLRRQLMKVMLPT